MAKFTQLALCCERLYAFDNDDIVHVYKFGRWQPQHG
jgi:hypothetical protein